MPHHVHHDHVAFALADDGPTVTLTGETCSVEGTWRVLNRLMLVTLDGPGEEGFLLERRPYNHTDMAPEGWDEAVERFGGVVVEVPAVPGRFRATLITDQV